MNPVALGGRPLLLGTLLAGLLVLGCGSSPSGAGPRAVSTTTGGPVQHARQPSRQRGRLVGGVRVGRTWPPPKLDQPTYLKAPTDAKIRYRLDPTKDYVIDLGDQPLHSGVWVWGGRNVVIIGGTIEIPRGPRTQSGFYFRRQGDGGTVHIEGVRISGYVRDAFAFEEPNDVTVQIQSVYVDSLHAEDETRWNAHPDLIQTWNGPSVLRVDGLTGYTPYQGFFLAPDQVAVEGKTNIPRKVDIRNVNIRVRRDLRRTDSIPLWKNVPFPLSIHNLWVQPGTRPHSRVCWPRCSVWKGVRYGIPPGGNLVTRGSVGSHYRAVGYRRGG